MPEFQNRGYEIGKIYQINISELMPTLEQPRKAGGLPLPK